MRIISGKYKGHKLKGFDIEGTRPTMDRVKESMFAMIQSYLKNSICLDLFAGSGNLGIEALSNGSKKVVFVDKNKIAIQTIEENLRKIQVQEDYETLNCDYQKALENLSERKIKFDFVFLDPPYRLNFINQILEQLNKYDLLNDQAFIICEYDKEEVASNTLACIKEKKYGNKYVKIYQKKG